MYCWCTVVTRLVFQQEVVVVMSGVVPALWTHVRNWVTVARQRVACWLVPSWFDLFCELNVLRSTNERLLARIRQMSERSEDRDFEDAYRSLFGEPGEDVG